MKEKKSRSKKLRTPAFWVKMRKKKDKSGEYYDILLGKRNSKQAHVHYGIKTDGSLHFIETRKKVQFYESTLKDKVTGKLLRKETLKRKGKHGEPSGIIQITGIKKSGIFKPKTISLTQYPERKEKGGRKPPISNKGKERASKG